VKWAWLLALGLIGCEGESADPGLDALLRVGAAQFVPGDMPASANGPAITAVANPTNQVEPGEVARPLGGSLAPGATAVLVQLVGDRGHWRVVAGAPDVAVPDQPTFSMQLSFARRLARDPVELTLAAVDSSGRVGPAQTVTLGLTAEVDPPALAVVLTWDRDADLDLRVVDPAGIEIFARNPSAAGDDNPGLPPTADQIAAAGRLDLDSNAACVIDGRRRERVIWPQTAPVGLYTVRVDTPDLCGHPQAHWQVEVLRDGTPIQRAEGVARPVDTRFDHGLGAGVFALSFQHGERP
jgi:hypothetical protein